MNVLTLDQSSKVTGYAVFDENGKLKDYGKIDLDYPKVSVRLKQLRERILSLIQQYKINYIVFEDIQLQSNIANNVQTFKILAEVYGIVEETLEEYNIPFETVLASVWKSTLGIKGRTRTEQKRNAQQYIIDTFGIKPIQDICDAICIGLHYFDMREPKSPWAN